MKIKVCGITSYEDARMALDLGADALGFNFFRKSPRYIHPSATCAIIRRLPVFAVTVGLFVNEPASADVVETAAAAGVGVIQLHGDESPEYCRELADGCQTTSIIKAMRVGDDGIPANLGEYDDCGVRAFLFDAKDDALFGGTGKSFDWTLAQDIGRRRPLILAGGLCAGNVRRAIETVRPYALDVCSGVESAPGKKDAGKLMEFMNEVRNVNQSANRA
ncbi:MAG: phosphoribosylanthranilate isomerase [Acidobacteriota bacterium]|jgi:phosphoribosylanthranilate isomerase|nr:phosphoribosylanthranilate isomerase [Acidobacteriota bacterium]